MAGEDIHASFGGEPGVDGDAYIDDLEVSGANNVTHEGQSILRRISLMQKELGQLATTEKEEDRYTRLVRMEAELGQIARLLHQQEVLRPEAESVQHDEELEYSYEHERSHIMAILDIKQRRLYLGADDEAGIRLGTARHDQTDYSSYRGSLLYTLIRNQEYYVSAEELWKLTYGKRPLNEKIMDKFRDWHGKATYKGKPIIQYDEEQDTFCIENHDISLAYITASGQEYFILPDGSCCRGRTAAIARDVMETLETGEYVSAAALRKRHGTAKNIPQQRQQISQSIDTFNKKRLPNGYKVESVWKDQNDPNLRRLMYYRVIPVNPDNDEPDAIDKRLESE